MSGGMAPCMAAGRLDWGVQAAACLAALQA